MPARRASRRRTVLLVVVLTALTLITLDTRNGRSGPLGTLGRVAHTILSPFQSAASNVASPLSDWWHGVTNSGHLKHENRNLRHQIDALKAQQRDAQQAIDNDRILRQQLGLSSKFDVKLVAGRIIGRDPGNFNSTLEIDRGRKNGIEVDMPVVAPDGTLVGIVVQVSDDTAVIRVLTDPGFALGVRLPERDGTPAVTGVAVAQTGTNELLDEDVDAQKKVAVGDVVTTSASSANLFPPDVQVGRVVRVEKQPNGQPQRVFIKPFVDLGALENVSVMVWVQGQAPVVITTTTSTSTSTTTTTVANTSTTARRNG